MNNHSTSNNYSQLLQVYTFIYQHTDTISDNYAQIDNAYTDDTSIEDYSKTLNITPVLFLFGGEVGCRSCKGQVLHIRESGKRRREEEGKGGEERWKKRGDGATEVRRDES